VTALVLQARIDSSRLSGKSLLPLGDKPLVFRVMEALASLSGQPLPWDLKILACPEDSVSSFAPLAEEAGFNLVPGPKDDVLARYCLAIRKSGAERIVRATGDNPFVFVDAAASINSEAQVFGADYAGYLGLPYGAGVESVASEALLRAEKEAKTREEREHVCPYLYGHPELFRLHRPQAPAKWQSPELRITVDTEDDYERAQTLYEYLLSLSPSERNLGENVIAGAKYILTKNSPQGKNP